MEKILIIDTETTNDLTDSLVYDCGFIVADYNGTIYSKHSFVNADIFCDKELMESAFFAEKIPTYWEEIKSGSRTLTSFNNIKWILRHIMKENNIKKVYAYNCRFDYCSLATTQRFLTKSKYRFFFPYGTEFHDILALARHCFKSDTDYHKFCTDNDYLTTYGKDRHTAEIVAQYLFDKDFTEEHTALADCEIEYKILLACEKLDGFNFETKMWQKEVTMKRFNGHLQITYNTKTKKIEIDPKRFMLLLVGYAQMAQSARTLMLQEIRQLSRED